MLLFLSAACSSGMLDLLLCCVQLTHITEQKWLQFTGIVEPMLNRLPQPAALLWPYVLTD
jgi:hypothetical protein